MVGILTIADVANTIRKNISFIVHYAGVDNGIADNDDRSFQIPGIFCTDGCTTISTVGGHLCIVPNDDRAVHVLAV